MTYEIVTAQFSSCEQVNQALSGLRQAGFIEDAGALPYAGRGRRAKLHLGVESGRIQLVREMLQHFGAQL